MAESTVIREFLVALGFRMDEGALQKFDAGIAQATKTVFKLAAAIETTAIAVAARVSRFSANLESLYFASQRTNSSIASLKALEQAGQHFGTTAGEMEQSVEGLASALRNNPGNEGFLAALGVQARDAQGHIRGAADLLLDLSKSKTFSDEPFYVANRQAQMLGISERTLLAMRQAGFVQEVERYKKTFAGLDAAGKTAHSFMDDIRDLGAQLEVFATQVNNALAKKLGISVKEITQWMQKNGPWLAKKTAEVVGYIIDAATKLAHWIELAIDKLKEWDKATNGLEHQAARRRCCTQNVRRYRDPRRRAQARSCIRHLGHKHRCSLGGRRRTHGALGSLRVDWRAWRRRLVGWREALR